MTPTRRPTDPSRSNLPPASRLLLSRRPVRRLVAAAFAFAAVFAAPVVHADGDASATGTGDGDASAITAEFLLEQTVGSQPMFPGSGTFTQLGIITAYRSDSPFYATFDFRALSDDRYSVGAAFLDIPFSFRIREAGLGYAGEPLSLRAGIFAHADVVESPYSLFISGRRQSAFLYEIDYTGRWLRLLTRSIELNRNSALGYPDRSVVFQTIGVHGDGWEVGFQDSVVAVPLPVSDGEKITQTSDGTGPVFVPALFFLPLPNYVTQYILGGGENPWRQSINYKSLMGFYGRMRLDLPLELEAQILIDDFNANAFVRPDHPHQNPFMGAWMLSGRMPTPIGAFRFSHAGSLMYTFQTSHNRRYSYTYYPEVVFPRGDEWQVIDYRDNYLGFFLGDNTVAFRLDWEHHLRPQRPVAFDLGLDGLLEYTVSGSKSPLNPWGDYRSWSDHPGEGPLASTRLLDEEVLEHGLRLGLSASASRRWGPGTIALRLATGAGVWFNVLRLDEVDRPGFPAPHDVEIYRPSDETHREASFTVGVSYRF